MDVPGLAHSEDTQIGQVVTFATLLSVNSPSRSFP